MKPPHKHHSFSGLIWLGVVLVVLVGIAWLLAEYTGFGIGVEREDLGNGQFLTRVPEGDIINEFPQELLLDDTTAVVVDSYMIEYTIEGAVQPVVVYTSTLPMNEMIDAYAAHLHSLEWFIVRSGDAETEGQVSLYARKAGEDVNLALAQNNDGTVQVTVSYLDRPDEEEPSAEEVLEE